MAFAPLRDFLDQKHVKYTWLNHSPAFTAQQIAQAAHIPGHEMAKTIIMWVDKS